jgi:N6-adenosine-specific RNA methylase IME4
MTVQPPSRSGEYQAIYADPPWRFATYSEKGKGRSAEAHYDCMTLPEIKGLPVASWAAADTALFLWSTDPMLRHALDVIDAWGFTYKTVAFYWVKLNKGRGGIFLTPRDFFTGMGFWTRANPELCLLATRGKPRRRGTDVAKLLIAARREHSRLATRVGYARQPSGPVRWRPGPDAAPAVERTGTDADGVTLRWAGRAEPHPGGRIGQRFPGLRAFGRC